MGNGKADGRQGMVLKRDDIYKVKGVQRCIMVGILAFTSYFAVSSLKESELQ